MVAFRLAFSGIFPNHRNTQEGRIHHSRKRWWGTPMHERRYCCTLRGPLKTPGPRMEAYIPPAASAKPFSGKRPAAKAAGVSVWPDLDYKCILAVFTRGEWRQLFFFLRRITRYGTTGKTEETGDMICNYPAVRIITYRVPGFRLPGKTRKGEAGLRGHETYLPKPLGKYISCPHNPHVSR